MKRSITKAAALVLLWNLCLCTALWSAGLLVYYLNERLTKDGTKTATIIRTVLPSLIILPALPFSGWLADSKFGNFKMFRTGSVLTFLGCVLISVCILVAENLTDHASFIFCTVTGLLSHLLSFSGGSACLVTVFQLGLDQMPDASSATIITYNLLFYTTFFGGVWISSSLFTILENCTNFCLSVQGASLLPVLCMCIIQITYKDRSLVIEPKSPQALKNIYKVLKFAVKHKAPVNRSALTYWEEYEPSRINLGKSRYGGPFTTEQVNDVKTLFRILLVFLPVWIIAFSTTVFGSLEIKEFLQLMHHNLSAQVCVDSVYMQFTYSVWWCVTLTLLVYMTCVLPCFVNRLPSSLKRVGIYLFILVLCNAVYSFVSYYFLLSIWPRLVHTWILNAFITLGFSTLAEFVCAQSPYNTRGLLFGVNLFGSIFSATLGALVFNVLLAKYYSKHCLIIPYSFGGGLSIAGFLLFLVIAGCYKRRVRDEEYHPQTVIEEIYDRYLTQAQQYQPAKHMQ